MMAEVSTTKPSEPDGEIGGKGGDIVVEGPVGRKIRRFSMIPGRGGKGATEQQNGADGRVVLRGFGALSLEPGAKVFLVKMTDKAAVLRIERE